MSTTAAAAERGLQEHEPSWFLPMLADDRGVGAERVRSEDAKRFVCASSATTAISRPSLAT